MCVCVYMNMSVGIGKFGIAAPLTTQNCGVQVIPGYSRPPTSTSASSNCLGLQKLGHGY